MVAGFTGGSASRLPDVIRCFESKIRQFFPEGVPLFPKSSRVGRHAAAGEVEGQLHEALRYATGHAGNGVVVLNRRHGSLPAFPIRRRGRAPASKWVGPLWGQRRVIPA